MSTKTIVNPDGTVDVLPLTEEEIAEISAIKESAEAEASSPKVLNAPIHAQIAAIDTFLPRGVEDLIVLLQVDVTKLPQEQQDRLKQKAALRAQLVR